MRDARCGTRAKPIMTAARCSLVFEMRLVAVDRGALALAGVETAPGQCDAETMARLRGRATDEQH